MTASYPVKRTGNLLELIIEMIVAERNRRMSSMGAARRDIDATIRFLRDRLEKIDEQMKTLIAKHPEWSAKAALLDSVSGVGPF
jgi:transposase